jgi:hypothetical protein
MRWRWGIFWLKQHLNRALHGCPFMFSNQKHGVEELLMATATWPDFV